MINEFIDRKNKKREIRYLVPELESILKDTYGSIVYQEQIMQIAQKLAGFTLGEADLLRQAMGKKKPKEMAKYRLKFHEGCKKNNHDPKIAEELFDMMVSFAEYCFNKSHSAAYGMLTYQTAYLKANYPIEYMTALLSSVLDDQDKIKYYMSECKNMGIAIHPPDINLSGTNFTADIKNNFIRFGLGAIKNVGIHAVNEIIKARSENNVFSSLYDFCSKVDLRVVNKKTLESLIKAGAFDSLKDTRKNMIDALENIVSLANKKRESVLSGQLTLFGEVQPEVTLSNGNNTPTTKNEYSKKELQTMEKELTGFYISNHPLEDVPEIIQKACTCNLSEIHEMPDNTEVFLLAIISEYNKKLTKSNKFIGILQLEDIMGKCEAVIFSDQMAQYNEFLIPEVPLLLLGKVQQRSEGNISIQIKALQAVENIKITVIETNEDMLDKNNFYTSIHSLRSVIQKEKLNSFNPIILKSINNGNSKSYILDRKLWIEPSDNFINNIKKISPNLKVNILSPCLVDEKGTTSQIKYTSQKPVEIPF
jgi:DNA polymerase-3 subunit alpha